MVNRARIVAVAALVAVSLLATALPAQAANTETPYNSPTPSTDGETMYFAGYAPGKGTELFKTDGTAEGTVLVKDLYPGTKSSMRGYFEYRNSVQFTNLGDKTFFFATDATGRQLWVTDGTSAGTIRLTTGKAGIGDGMNAAVFNGELYFSGRDAQHGWEIWKSDGTLAGTSFAFEVALGANANGSPIGASAHAFVAVDDHLFFGARTAGGLGVYATADGATATLVKAYPYSYDVRSYYRDAIAFEGTYVYAVDGTYYATGPTAGSTVSLGSSWSTWDSPIVEFDGSLFTNTYPKSTNGVTAPTLGRVVGKTRVAVATLPVINHAALAGKLWFQTWDEAAKTGALWTLSSATAEPVKIKDIFVAPYRLDEFRPISVGDSIYFWSQRSLWVSDGTAEGTHIVKNFGFSKVQAWPMELAALSNGTIVATGLDRYGHGSMWLSDGTEAGTYQRLATGVMTAVVPGVSGTAAPGSVLKGSVGKWAPVATSWKYQWKIDGVAVAGANSLTFMVPDVAIGSKVQLTVTGFRSGYQTISKTSQAKVTVGAFTAPVPTISGTLAVGEYLTVDPGIWTPAATLSYQWYANGKIIAGKTGMTYQLTTRSVLRSITVKVTGKKTGYATLTRTSLPAQ